VLQIPIGAEADFIGVVDLVQMKALTWRGETKLGEDYAIEEIPAELADQAAEYREKLLEGSRRERRLDHGVLPRGEEISVETIKAAIRKATIAGQVNPVVDGFRVQEQGRPAHARRGHRLPAQPARHRGDRRHGAGRRDRGPAARRRGRAVLGAGVQDPDRPAPRAS
jgi:hypothetical protein